MVVFDHRIMAECHFVWWRRFVVPLLLLAVAIVHAQKVTAVAASSTVAAGCRESCLQFNYCLAIA